NKGTSELVEKIAKDSDKGTKAIKNSIEGAGNATGSYKQLVDAGQKDAHHIIQDAAMREIDGYNRFSAPSIQLDGPSTIKGIPHNIATSIQRQTGGEPTVQKGE
ncbi:hypothetical protein, partial [Clostridium sp.]|uniref:hypothetical protein n=1 Tax=Clostridium sp. TaxID=1506 RepID=UPI002633DBF3